MRGGLAENNTMFMPVGEDSGWEVGIKETDQSWFIHVCLFSKNNLISDTEAIAFMS